MKKISIDKNKIEKKVNKVKVVSKNYLKTNVLFMTFVLTSLINGCLLRFLTVKNYFDFRPVIADLAFILIIGAFGYFIKPKHQQFEVMFQVARMKQMTNN